MFVRIEVRGRYLEFGRIRDEHPPEPDDVPTPTTIEAPELLGFFTEAEVKARRSAKG